MRTSSQLQDTSGPTVIAGLAEIADNYDGYIVDLWGVVHNGEHLFDAVLPCLRELKDQGKTVVFLSNAPRSSGVIVDQLSAFGLPRDLYADVITSGDATLEYLRRHDARTYHHIGCPEKDGSLLIGIGMNPASHISQADIIIASNFDNNRPTLDEYADDLEAALSRSIPMICANPDLMVYRGEVKVLCAATLAQEYEKRGGTVLYFGKPHSPVYNYLLHKYQAENWLAIGDALATDIEGANKAGLDSLLVLSGIHQNDERSHDGHEAKPKYVADKFTWL